MTKEEAINEIKSWDFLEGKEIEAIQTLIPELRESEDERTRKELLAVIRAISSDCQYAIYLTHDQKQRYLAWLEKQGEKEQKPISAAEVLARAGLKPYKDGNQWCILAGDNIQEGICGFGDTIENALYEFLKEVLDLQKEQKPAEWSEEDEESLACAISVFEGFAEGKNVSVPPASAKRYLKRLKSLRPVKQEWSEEEIGHLYTLARYIKSRGYEDDGEFLEGVANKLKSFCSQPYKVSVHELAIRFMNYLDKNRPEGKIRLSTSECLDIDKAFAEKDWAKILRYINKYGWKPSEEQIYSLGTVVKGMGDVSVGSVGYNLKSLYEQLKKL
jgi:hypothetical protein